MEDNDASSEDRDYTLLTPRSMQKHLFSLEPSARCWEDVFSHSDWTGHPEEAPESSGERLALFRRCAEELKAAGSESESSAQFTTAELTEQDAEYGEDPYSYGHGIRLSGSFAPYRGPPRLYGCDSSTEYEESEDEDEEMGGEGSRRNSRPSAAQRHRRSGVLNAERHIAQHYRGMLRAVQAELAVAAEAKVKLEEECSAVKVKAEEAEKERGEAEAQVKLAQREKENAERSLVGEREARDLEREMMINKIKALEERLAGTGGESGVKLEVDM